MGGQHKFSLSCIWEFGFQIKWKLNWKHLLVNYIRLTSKSNWESTWRHIL